MKRFGLCSWKMQTLFVSFCITVLAVSCPAVTTIQTFNNGSFAADWVTHIGAGSEGSTYYVFRTGDVDGYLQTDFHSNDNDDGIAKIYFPLAGTIYPAGTAAGQVQESWMQFDVKCIGGSSTTQQLIAVGLFNGDGDTDGNPAALWNNGCTGIMYNPVDTIHPRLSSTGYGSGLCYRVKMHIYNSSSSYSTIWFQIYGLNADGSLGTLYRDGGNTFLSGPLPNTLDNFGIKNLASTTSTSGTFYFDNIYFSTEGEFTGTMPVPFNITDGFDARRNSALAEQVADPYPYPDPTSTDLFVWGKLDYALAALYLNTQLTEANQAILDACTALHNDPLHYPGEGDGFHWDGNLFFRIYEFFNHDSAYFPGRLTPQAEAAIYDIFWGWVKSKSVLADTEMAVSKTWYIWESENHDAQRDITCYGAAAILKDAAPYNTYLYDDGSTAAQQYHAWNAYFKEYLRERAKKGLLVEIASVGYAKYTLQGWYNLYDFAEDPELSKLAEMTLDLWWADWAHEQINGVRGGGKTRVYPDGSMTAIKDAAYWMCWFYFGLMGYHGDTTHPSLMCPVTSEYRLPLVVMDLAYDVSGRGTYEFKSRRPGLNLIPKPGTDPDMYYLNPDFGGIYRYTYTTPEFIMGSLMFERRPYSEWSAISSQNRWFGVIFNNHVDSRIFPQCVADTDSTYNQYWCVQNKGTLIVQKLDTTKNTNDMRVYFSRSRFNSIVEENGWIFADVGGSYAAVRPVSGTYTWDDTNWMRCSETYSPVIIEVAKVSNYANFAAFRTAVKSLPMTMSSGVLTYTGLGNNGTFTFYANYSQLPKVNGVSVNLQPAYTFDSPFMHEDWASGNVVIQKDGRKCELDFNNAVKTVYEYCESGYFQGDLNKDCTVDLNDLKMLVDQWLSAAVEGGISTQPFSDSVSIKGLWHFDSSSINSSDDVIYLDDDSLNTGRNNDLREWSGGAPFINLINDGKFGNAVDLDYIGSDSYMLVAAQNWNDTWKTFAYRGWIRFADAGDTGGYLAHIYDRVYLFCDTSKVTFKVTDGVSTVEVIADLVPTTDWQYVEAIYNGSTISITTETDWASAAGIGDITLGTGKGFYIGSRKNRNRFVGQMDEVRVSLADNLVCANYVMPNADLNNDCILNLKDLAIIAQDWLKCNDID